MPGSGVIMEVGSIPHHGRRHGLVHGLGKTLFDLFFEVQQLHQ